MTCRTTRRFGRIGWQKADGTATIEFAFAVTFLSFLAVGVLDFGMGFWQYMQVQNAVDAGANYAIVNGYDTTGISSAVTGATGLSGLTMTTGYPQRTCGCPTGSGSTITGFNFVSITCGSTCAAGGTAQRYILIAAQSNYSTIFTWPGLANPVTLTASSYVLN